MTKKLYLMGAGLLHASTLLAVAPGADELDEVFASRGNGQVTYRQFDARMDRIPEQDRSPFLRDKSRLQKILAELLLKEQLAADARADGFDQNPTVQARMELAATAELAEAWLAHYVAAKPQGDLQALAHDFYLSNPDQFVSGESIDVSHILISTDDRTEEEAETIALEIHGQLVADPGRFEELVTLNSDDPAAASRHGQYTGVKRGDMVKSFEDAAFALEIGAISEPVLTQYGYHIIRLDALNEAGPVAFEAVEDSLIKQEQARHEKRIRVDYLNRVASVETSLTEEAMLKMLSRYVDGTLLNKPEDPDSE